MNSRAPLISVIMPAYNAADFLAEAIESVRSQTFADWEMVIANDCSTDGTPEIIDRYAALDSRIRRVDTPHNSGRCLEPRLLAANNAVGQWVVAIDADDTIEPACLDKLVQRQHECGADMVLPVMYRMSAGERPYRAVPAEDFRLDTLMPGHDAMMLTIGEWKIGFAGVLCRRGFYREAAGALPDAPAFQFLDEYLSRLLLDRSRYVAWADAAYFYRVNDSSVTRAPRAARHGYLLNDRLIYDYCANRYGVDSDGAVAAKVAEFHHLIDVIRSHRDSPEPDPEEYASVERLIRDTYRRLDFRTVKHHVSPRYYLLMRLGLRPARLFLSLYDKTKGRKHI
ncbi:MAG TPA: hypothetical protein DC009_08820 [Porphyromonadaceae bacterium]|nr:hypothetical protein [Porphyromonadaceae bacterium]